MKLAQRVAVITGAGQGIGAACARVFAANGAKVVIADVNAAPAMVVVDEIVGAGGIAVFQNTDVSASSDCDALLERAVTEFGRVDMVVNNAGIVHGAEFLDLAEADFDRVLRVNLKGAFNFVRAAARTLMKTHGRIVNIASVVGITGNVGQSNYAASKASLSGFTRSIAKELAPRAVCVNAVAPGMIETDMTAGIPAPAAEAMRAAIPLKRAGTPEEVALVVDVLLGPGGDYITGQTLVLDGGLSL